MYRSEIIDYCICPEATVKEAIAVINNNKDGIVLVVDKDGVLVGTVTDGDIRRFMLANRSFDESCSNVMCISPTFAYSDTSPENLRMIMEKNRLRNIPILDEFRRPVGLVNLQDLFGHRKDGQIAVVMAGGKGERLYPITKDIPKPMVVVGDKPILETIIGNLTRYGISRIYISVNHHAQIIENYFGDGRKFGAEISYLRENKKLGTAGSLSLLPSGIADPILVMNGDVLTGINFTRLLDFHRQHKCMMCVAATEYHISIPYGVLNLAGHFLLGIEEKPSQRFLCNAGIYVIDPYVLKFVPHDTRYDMTDLLNEVIKDGLPVAGFPVHEEWFDIGRKEDLSKALESYSKGFAEKHEVPR